VVILFCDKCGKRVAPGDLTSGAARQVDETHAVCAECHRGRSTGATAHVEALPRRDTRTAVVPARRERPPAPAPMPAPSHADGSSSKVLIFAGVGVTVLVLALIAVAMGTGGDKSDRKESRRKPLEERAAAPPPPGPSSGPATPAPPAQPDSPPTPVPEAPKESKTEEFDARAAVAASALTQAKRFASSDPWAYREQLETIARRYTRTPAADEAARLLEEWKPPSQRAPAGQEKPRLDGSEDTYLRLSDALSTTIGYGTIRDGEHISGGPLRIGGKEFTRGIGTHAHSVIVFDLGSRYEWLTGYFGVDKRVAPNGSIVLEVWGNGGKLFDSGVRRGHEEALFFKVRVKDIAPLRLVVTESGDGGGCDHADLGNLRLLVKETEPTEDYAAAGAAAKTEPAGTGGAEKPAETPEQEGQALYAQFLAGFQAMLAQKGWALARARLDDALKNAKLSGQREALTRDGELLALAEKAWQAVPKGAAALADGRAFTLVQADGKRFPVGQGTKTAVRKADAEQFRIEQDIGGGTVTLNVPFSKLTPETLFELARAGLPDDGEGKLALALMKYPAARAGERGKEAAAEKDLRVLLDAAEKAAAPGGKVAALRAWLAFAEREQAAAQAYRQVEELIEAKKGDPAKAAWEAFRKEYSTTAFFTDARPKSAELEERLRLAAYQPGLWCSYWKREGGNNYARKLLARAEKSVYINYDNERPPEAPKDNHSSLWSGVLRLEKDGRYTIRVDVDDNGKLWLDGRSLGEARFAQDARSFEVDLTAGDHAITIEHQQGHGNSHVFVTWKPPGANDLQPVPLAALWHQVGRTAEYERPPK
jgi:hypothetical protein